MRVYAESSAVLGWLFSEPDATRVRLILAAAELVVASDLTLIECDRALIRGAALGQITAAQAAERRAILERAGAHWIVLQLAPEVVERARRAFPAEPIRTLDALHLATALLAGAAVPGLAVLSVDRRIRTNAQALGLSLLP